MKYQSFCSYALVLLVAAMPAFAQDRALSTVSTLTVESTLRGGGGGLSTDEASQGAGYMVIGKQVKKPLPVPLPQVVPNENLGRSQGGGGEGMVAFDAPKGVGDVIINKADLKKPLPLPLPQVVPNEGFRVSQTGDNGMVAFDAPKGVGDVIIDKPGMVINQPKLLISGRIGDVVLVKTQQERQAAISKVKAYRQDGDLQ